jgi:hypothetical protein
MKKEEVIKNITRLYKDIDAFALSNKAIQASEVYYNGYIYDEMTNESFYDILKEAGAIDEKIFYDLGSGVGKKVFISSLGFHTKKSIGIEILPLLHQNATNILQKSNISPDAIGFIQKDFTTYDFSDADVVFLSLTMVAMEIELTGTVSKKLDQLKVGSTLITTGFPTPSNKYELIESVPCEFIVSPPGFAFIQKKIS